MKEIVKPTLILVLLLGAFFFLFSRSYDRALQEKLSMALTVDEIAAQSDCVKSKLRAKVGGRLLVMMDQYTAESECTAEKNRMPLPLTVDLQKKALGL